MRPLSGIWGRQIWLSLGTRSHNRASSPRPAPNNQHLQPDIRQTSYTFLSLQANAAGSKDEALADALAAAHGPPAYAYADAVHERVEDGFARLVHLASNKASYTR
ncbi:hypothetical protein AYL99_11866 [Fonsecaea erecta]|uniref:Uncharacterized protein n=1 Tax=Fonsecaea erecta TaxID=1367422 RepID=A0A178Z3G8_9EURO|nr:hypothetical protein AYL99_11866 [Fonsecaea erecta]OAP53986.1 hypothetical protein AYL99_11866 [Fonsecaea erecta]